MVALPNAMAHGYVNKARTVFSRENTISTWCSGAEQLLECPVLLETYDIEQPMGQTVKEILGGTVWRSTIKPSNCKDTWLVIDARTSAWTQHKTRSSSFCHQ